ncbi:UDP-N-acetylmuramoyl-L-alanyl-D-glutamate--2,6-diaminopimelate ligase [Aestuariibacter halophilus]|uniref:UDP-N-acetylmuramyl-tripeptide synthetase n=1 Tax=Fluctibacter halophilus TaxID=226011 RepID=A0ABS8G778_9ALTE|nr:UDP-N-acetylmuramoyl-L-alanyl-D-glutamate--2,6-diaminopimelate ligase [Aestuariibacter halophilus]MCC2616447.1 UDP-N-acetylmuramoyl-L-alanyl-D-glutamate--2,6-diaminopimelate ligase [Aestuariibacter halophilus]
MAQNSGKSIQPLLAGYGIEAPDIRITDLVLDSREVAIHKGFVAIKGHQRDGRDFIPQAISLGAKVILAECDEVQQHGALQMREQSLIISFYRLATSLSELACRFYDYPAKAMDVVAVTGTNGKTSTVQLITQWRHAVGEVCASVGTLGAGVYAGQQADLDETVNTTPDAVQMPRLLADFVTQGVRQVALEASSHALVQGRIAALDVNVAVFTNLTRDHLDYHGTMAEYANAKRRLLAQPGLTHVVVNLDDPESRQWINALPEQVQLIGITRGKHAFSLPEGALLLRAEQTVFHSAGCDIQLTGTFGQGILSVSLLGAFNVHNVLCAMASLLALGVDFDTLLAKASSLHPVAGRMEVFSAPGSASVVVDYAHTPDALQQALTAMADHCHGQRWVVFGCGGDRDTGKRPLMGEVAERFADRIILTNDNSRSEQPLAIVNDILAGCRQPEAIDIILDRKAAIQSALQHAAPEDMILVAGKGHENYQIIGSDVLDYDERDYVKNTIKGNAQ